MASFGKASGDSKQSGPITYDPAELASTAFKLGAPVDLGGVDGVTVNGFVLKEGANITLTTDSANNAVEIAASGGGGGSGDVVGPLSATDAAICSFDGTTGKLIQDSGVTISGGIISGLTDPAVAQDAATKAYADTKVDSVITAGGSGEVLIGTSGSTEDVQIKRIQSGTGIGLATDGNSITISATGGGGSGDVVGPASATDNAVCRYDTATGELIQNSGVIISDSNAVTGVASLTATGNVEGGTLTDGTLSINGGDITGGGSITASTLTQDSGSVTISTTTSGNVVLNPAGDINLSSNDVINGGDIGTTTVTASGAIEGGSLTDGTATLSSGILTRAGGDVTISTTTSGNVVLNPAGDVNVSSSQIKGVTDPTLGTDAANKQYVDAVAIGLGTKAPCRVATDAALPSYDQAGSGIGATLTANPAVVLPDIDGVTLATDDRILVKDGASASDNGIYTVTSATSPWVLTRATDADNSPAGEVKPGMYTFITEGTANANKGFVLSDTATDPTAIDVDDLNFVQFTAGTGGGNVTGSGTTATEMISVYNSVDASAIKQSTLEIATNTIQPVADGDNIGVSAAGAAGSTGAAGGSVTFSSGAGAPHTSGGTGGVGGTLTISSKEGGNGSDPGSTGGDGGGLTISSGAGGSGVATGGDGGDINITASNGGNTGGAGTTGDGGDINITSGNSATIGSTSGASGSITLTAGDATATGGIGGNITLIPGSGASGEGQIILGEGDDNTIEIRTPASSSGNTSTYIDISTGDTSTNGDTGGLTLQTGRATGSAGSGRVELKSGINSGTSGETGDVIITTGNSNGPNVCGKISLKAGKNSGLGPTGAIELLSGNGGNNSNNDAVSPQSGGVISITGGTGGAKTVGTAAGGAGAGVTVTGGVGGTSDTAAGGAGGVTQISGGDGGAATAGSGDGGAGGNVKLAPGAGGSSSGGADGAAGHIDCSLSQVKNVADPTADQDAATKNYNDTRGSKLPVKYKTQGPLLSTGALSSNGTTIQRGENGALQVDGETVSVLGQRILVDETATNLTAAHRGIYELTQAGSGSEPWILTRTDDADTSAKVFPGMTVFITEGTDADQGYILTNNSVTLNTTALTFSKFTASSSGSLGTDISSDFSLSTANSGNISSNTLQVYKNGTIVRGIFAFTCSGSVSLGTPVFSIASAANKPSSTFYQAGNGGKAVVSSGGYRTSGGSSGTAAAITGVSILKKNSAGSNVATWDSIGMEVTLSATASEGWGVFEYMTDA